MARAVGVRETSEGGTENNSNDNRNSMANSDMNYLWSQYTVLRWLGVFCPGRPESARRGGWTLWAVNTYRVAIFAMISLITALMTVQMFVATDLTILARTIDIWTMFLSGLYKWFYMVACSSRFAELSSTLPRIQSQGSVARGRCADPFTAHYLRFTPAVTTWYMLSGMVAAFFIIVSPLLTYPKGYFYSIP